MKTDHRGITLVELIIAVAISAVIMGAATYFMGSAQKSFVSAQETADLQMEAQILMEQVSAWIMEGNGVKAEGDMLVIYSIPRKTDTPMPDGITSDFHAKKRIIWQQGGKLYMKTETGIADADSDTTAVTEADASESCCIGDYVKQFTPEVFAAEPGEFPTVKITLQMAEGRMTYTLENEVMPRNEWLLSGFGKGRIVI